MTSNITIYFSGNFEFDTSKEMTFALLVLEDGKEVYSWTGKQPQNNGNSQAVADYIAFSNGLDYILENGMQDELIQVKCSSEMVVNQMIGKWGIRSGYYTKLAHECKRKLEQIPNISIDYVFRNENLSMEVEN